MPGLGVLRIEYMLAGIGMVRGILLGKNGITSRYRTELFFLGIMFPNSCIAILVQVLMGNKFIWRDLMIFVQLTYYVFVVFFVAMACTQVKSYTTAERFLVVVGFLISIISIAQYFNFMNINNVLVPLFRENYQALQQMFSWRRVIGTLGNPNYWGLVVSMVLLFIFYSVFWQKNLKHVLLLFLLFVSIILSGSRTTLISCLAGALFGSGILWFTIYDKPSLRMLLVVTVVVFVLVRWLEIDKFYENVNRFSINNVKTLELRKILWSQIWDASTDNIMTFFIGHGPRKAEIIRYADNSYFRILREYGVVGVFLYVCLLGVMIKRTISLIGNKNTEGKMWSSGLLFILLSWVIFEFATDAWFNVRATALLLSIYIFVHTVAYNRQSVKEC